MGKHRKGTHRPSSGSDTGSTSSSDDNDGPQQLLLRRYQQADLASGLAHRGLRLAALQELQEILDQGLFSSSDKKVQHAVFDDLLLAAQQRDSRARVRQAVSALLSTAKRVLAQKQRQQLSKVEKQAAVAASRAARKEAAGTSSAANQPAGSDSEEDEDCRVMLGDVPLEVVAVILQSLDPVSLAAAACVCRSWYELATCDDCWRSHLQAAYPRSSARLQQQQQQQQQQEDCNAAAAPLLAAGVYARFCSEARKHPAALLPWKACRALRLDAAGSRHLEWRLPGSTSAAAAAACGGRSRCLQQLTPAVAVQWMTGVNSLGGHGGGGTSDDSGSSSGSGSEEEDEDEQQQQLQTSRLRLWSIGC